MLSNVNNSTSFHDIFMIKFNYILNINFSVGGDSMMSAIGGLWIFIILLELGFIVLVVYALILAIIALKIYISKNQNNGRNL